MTISLLADKPAPEEMLVDLARLEHEYFECRPDLDDPTTGQLWHQRASRLAFEKGLVVQIKRLVPGFEAPSRPRPCENALAANHSAISCQCKGYNGGNIPNIHHPE